ncbi:hypothetical protein SLE2022_144190 [Rubroshorea leprosula]
MSLPMGFSCEDDLEKIDSEVILIDESRESKQRAGMDFQYHHGNGIEFDLDVEFWPVEHPMEPPDEDRPVKCPIPTASSVINDGKMKQERTTESLLRGKEQPEMKKVAIQATERPIRAVRKRQHTLIRDDHSMKPLTRMPPLPTQNITIFQMLQEVDKFES